MNIALISTTVDPASINIKEQLLENYDFLTTELEFAGNPVHGFLGKDDIKLYTINDPLIYAENIDEKIDVECLLFLSKHKAAEGRASLTVHPIGNFGKAEVGGEAGKLCPVAASLFKAIFQAQTKACEGTEYESTTEATHHGPFVDKPALFIELGSAEEHWNDKNGATLLANSLMQALEQYQDAESYFVIGGGHYNHVANKVLLESKATVGHICPKYNFENLNDDTLQQAMHAAKSKKVLFDWKGLGKHKQAILDVLEKNNISYEQSNKFFQ